MRTLFLCIAALALQMTATASPSQVANPAERDAVRTLVERGTLQQLRRPDFARLRPVLDDVYRAADYTPRWFSAQSAPRAMVAELADAPSHGLDAADYDVEWLDRELGAIHAGDTSPERIARADVALTVSFFRFASDPSWRPRYARAGGLQV